MDTRHVVLHRYFIWANVMRTAFDEWLKSAESAEGSAAAASDPAQAGFEFLATRGGAYMAVWYAALHVVVEGWKKLKLTDPDIDRLLTSPNTDLLRQCRNAVCHYQPQWLDHRVEAFVSSRDSASWARELNEAFGGYFLRMHAAAGNAPAEAWLRASASRRSNSAKKAAPPKDPT